MPKVVINLVTWNSLTYLPYCLNSVFNQTYKDFYLLVIDNGSTDGSIEFIQKNFPQVKVLRNTHNLGYSKAHNQGILLTKSDYVLVLNHDVILSPDFIGHLVAKMESDPKIASIGGKTLKFHFKPGELREVEFTDIIDSAGLTVFKNRRFANRGENTVDRAQFDNEEEVFGISGSIVLLRRQALEDIRFKDEFFDPDFFMYKEDDDLAWRLRLRGWKSLYLPQAVAYHHRRAQGKDDQDTRSLIKGRRKKSQFINYHSYKNHLLTILKNEQISNLFRSFPFIFSYELMKIFYLAFFERSTLKSLPSFIKLLPKMLQKRKFIQKNIIINKAEIRKCFN